MVLVPPDVTKGPERSGPFAASGRAEPEGGYRGEPRMDPAATPPPPPRVAAGALAWGFCRVGLSGFGGVLPFARRMLVEQRGWLTEQEFNEVLSLAQFLPGPNIVNVAVIVGRRFAGPVGAIAASFGLMLMPLVIVVALAAAFARFAELEAVRGACSGVSAAASGLVFSVGIKMARPILGKRWPIAIAVGVFAAIGLLRLPLLWVLVVLAPVSLGFAWRSRQ
jgi:chromate transporter